MTPTGRAGQLAGKYHAALRAIDEHDIHLMQILEQDGKLRIHGAALSREARKKITEKLDQVDANWSREVELDLHAHGADRRQPLSAYATPYMRRQPRLLQILLASLRIGDETRRMIGFGK